MVAREHPASLNALRRFRQASSIFRTTSRAGNPGWYLPALAHDFQVHLRVDGREIVAFGFELRSGRWSSQFVPDSGFLTDPEVISAWFADLLKVARSLGARSIGLILYVADEFATAELRPELEDPGAIAELRETALHDPASILADSSINTETQVWRVLPFPSSGDDSIGTTVVLSRGHASFLDKLRELGEAENFPIVTQGVSAPLVVLSAVPQLVELATGRSFAAILRYPNFTVLGFFDEKGELMLIRTQQHPGVRRQSNLSNAIQSTSASLELQNPDLYVITLGSQGDGSLVAELRETLRDCKIEQVRMPSAGKVPDWCAEPVLAVAPQPDGGYFSRSFEMLRGENWAFQDFLPPVKDWIETYPTQGEMKLLKSLRLARIGMAGLGILGVGWAAYGVLNIMRQPEWAFNPADATFIKGRLSRLNAENAEIERFENLLEDRSKAWSSMELLSILFPEDTGIRVLEYNHSVRPDTTPGLAQVGFVKSWHIKGLARREGTDLLQSLNTRDGITECFVEMVRLTGDTSYDPSIGNRSLTPNLRTQENRIFKQRPAEEISDLDDSTYPLGFDLTITQRFESTDPLALEANMAPRTKKRR